MRRPAERILAFVLVLELTAGFARASWFSEITGIDINIPAGTIEISTPKPQAIPEMLRNLPLDVGQALLAPHGAALAAAIRNGAAQALSDARPIPPDVRAVLSRFFPPYILDKAQWNVYDPNRIAIDGAIFGWFNSEGAITLDRVVVFRDAAVAQSDWRLWAHELTHVSQYDNMGV
ncbi:MAG TPA: DUF4157 domain-containing protein, partial [Thermoanaerobaculia bacterium]|nr:DUF4157 domain-containing protein [Thermoanaerobaculia bacterium]